MRTSACARATAWASTHFRRSRSASHDSDSESTTEEWTAATPHTRPHITTEELFRDIIGAIHELGVVSSFENNVALQSTLSSNDPVIARRLGILRLRFHPDSIPSPENYRQLIFLTSSGLQGLATTVTAFLRERQHE